MSYSESNNQVILTMSREDYDRLLMVMAMAAGFAVQHQKNPVTYTDIFGLADRLNEGNPHYTPYKLPTK